MIVLDTDHVSVLQRPSAAADELRSRLQACGDSVFATVITLEEQSRSWITALGRWLSDLSKQVTVYDRIEEMFSFFAGWRILRFSPAAAEEFKRLRKTCPRIGRSDLKIAAIVIVENGTLLTANTRDFERVPNLQFENWL